MQRRRLIFIGVREDLGIEPSHPLPTHGVPVSLREAIADLSQTVQDEGNDHVWIDEIKRGTRWSRIAAGKRPGEKIVFNSWRLSWDRPLPCLTTGGPIPPYIRNAGCHPEQIRTLSIREFARCGSFPDWYQFGDKPLRWGRFGIGNSVPPLLMKAIAEHVKNEIISFCPGRPDVEQAPVAMTGRPKKKKAEPGGAPPSMFGEDDWISLSPGVSRAS